MPTFRTPHVTLAFTGDLDERLTTLTTLAAKIADNPYHEPEPDDHPGR